MSIESKESGEREKIVEVLHTAVCEPQFDVRLKLFGGDCLARIRSEVGPSASRSAGNSDRHDEINDMLIAETNRLEQPSRRSRT